MPTPPDRATTLHVRDTCLCLHAQRAARALARRFDQALAPVGLTNGQFSLLMSLNRPQAPTMGDVARVLAMDRTTLTSAIKPLARQGLLDVRRDPKDGRIRRLHLLEAGRQRLALALPIWTENHGALEGALGEEPTGVLRALLREVAAIEDEAQPQRDGTEREPST